MAYNKEDLIKKSLNAIKKHKLIFIEEVVSYLPCDKTTFYRHECHECNEVKEALEDNKVSEKVQLRKNWRKSKNPALNIALYRLCATDQEIDKISTSKHKVAGDKDNPLQVNINIPSTGVPPITSENDIPE